MKCYYCDKPIVPNVDHYTWDTGRCGMPVVLHTGERWHAESCYTKHKELMRRERVSTLIKSID